MPLVPAICTQCGVKVEVDNSLEAAVCKFCGTPFIVEKAITKYNTTINNNFAGANVTISHEDAYEHLRKKLQYYSEAGMVKEEFETLQKIESDYPYKITSEDKKRISDIKEAI